MLGTSWCLRTELRELSEATGASFGKCASFVAINGTILDFEKNVISNVLDLKTCSSEKQRFDVTISSKQDIRHKVTHRGRVIVQSELFPDNMETYGAIWSYM